MHFIAKAAAVAGLLLTAALPASADVIFDFVGTTYTPPGQATQFANRVNGQLVVLDDAYASGYRIERTQAGGFRTVENTDALRSISFNFLEERTSFAEFNFLPDPARSGASSFQAMIEIVAAPFSLPTGRIFYRDLDVLFDFTLAGASGAGLGGLIGTGNCFSPGCAFTTSTVQSTVAAPTPVPEPASLALFGMGLAGLGLIRRKRAA